ncbi:MAG: DUF2851 family protein [Chloroflexota bacterium]|nr:DUF2851 family protein [Chloroflexota bacterium]
MAEPRLLEETVVSLWERQAFDPAALRSLQLSVIFRGLPSDAGGPDYQDALLAWQDREIIAGDIEFHVASADWYTHGHHRDPHYNRVVLHVVWRDDGQATIQENGGIVPVLALERHTTNVLLLDSSVSAQALLPHACVARFRRFTTENLQTRIRHAGMTRFQERAALFSADMTCTPADQVAYTALFESLGYASNREACRQLADLVPYAWIMSVEPGERAKTLLQAAGFLSQGTARPPGRMTSDGWRLSRIRPGNHPAIRIEGMAHLLNRLGSPLAERLVDLVLDARRPAQLRAGLVASTAGRALIGAGRADEMACSAVLPLVAALVPDALGPPDLFTRYPSPPDTRWTRSMLDLLAEAGHDSIKSRTAADHQGLHHLYHRYCRREDSRGCPVCGSESGAGGSG